ncbi:MAG TPA: nitrilase-related carbon-nitrogen hydrolase [Solirubrobacteraceae bacterium]|jgi:predicted amidohydrolase|nr:nitrilase-related carbon-nitrogen hydrolase [Solirubrobacteraceae bacterium]
MTRALALGIAQLTAGPDADANRELSVSAARELFARGADLVVLPELIVPGYSADRAFLAHGAEPIDGPTTRAWQATAAAAGAYVCGGLCERVGDNLFNAAVLVGPEGIVLHYRKLHLFSAEKHVLAPGDLGLPVARTRFGVVGLCVCYDLRFVETARILALEGAELLCVPTAWLPGFDTQRWDPEGYCPQARGAQLQANLDQVFIACASQAGPSGGFDFLGSSVLCDPYGRTVLGPLPGSRSGLALTTIDLDQVTRAHDRGALINPGADRRSDVYGLRIGESVL